MTPEGYVAVVEDDRDLRETMGELLRAEGYAVRTFSDAGRALEHIERAPPPALILLDLMMPGKNGFWFLEQQLMSPWLAQIPVVVLTASRINEGSIGGARILRKPVALDELLEVVRPYLRRRQRSILAAPM